MKRLPPLNLGAVGIAVIVVSYLGCVGWVLSRSLSEGSLSEIADTGTRIVTVMHWQLEPGFREAMQSVIDDFNSLPHVRAANIEVRQLDVPQRVYNTLLNVHAISGTAPDLCQQSLSMIRRGSSVAQYFTPITEKAAQPNPYNQAEFLPTGLDPALAEALPSMSWRESLLDGMLVGWISLLQDYYAAPTSFQGQIKMFYNRGLMREAKALLREGMQQTLWPRWLEYVLRAPGNEQSHGFVTDTPALRDWLADDTPPRTLGQLLLVGQAIHQLTEQTGRTTLVPIAGSQESYDLFAKQYLVPFTSVYAERLDMTGDATVVGRETWLALDAGLWSFDDEPVRAYYDCLLACAKLFPAGFLGLDREQARRRFVNGQAAMMLTGPWDAADLFRTVEGRRVTNAEPAQPHEQVREVDGELRAGFRFQLGVFDFPLLPGPGERWASVTTHPPNEAKSRGATAFMVYQGSPNRDWAIEFLQYLTSMPVNTRFAAQAGLLPITIGAEPIERLRSFRPRPDGLAPGGSLGPTRAGADHLSTIYNGQFKNFLAGDIDYATMTQRILDAVHDPRSGSDRLWHRLLTNQRDGARKSEALIGSELARTLLLEESDAEVRYRRALRRSLLNHNGTVPLRQWREWFPGEPFPEY